MKQIYFSSEQCRKQSRLSSESYIYICVCVLHTVLSKMRKRGQEKIYPFKNKKKKGMAKTGMHMHMQRSGMRRKLRRK